MQISLQNHIVHDMGYMGCTRVHDMGCIKSICTRHRCTQSHCTECTRHGMYTITLYSKQQSFYMEACSHIGTNRWARFENISQALMVMHWKLDLGRLLFLFNTSKYVCMFNIYTFKRNLHVHMFSLSIRANVYNIHIIFYQIFTCTHIFEIDVKSPTCCKVMYIR